MSGRNIRVQSLIITLCFFNVAFAQKQQTQFNHPLDKSSLVMENFRDIHQDIWYILK